MTAELVPLLVYRYIGALKNSSGPCEHNMNTLCRYFRFPPAVTTGFPIGEGLYLKNKIITEEKRTKLPIIDIIGEGGWGIKKNTFPLNRIFL